MGVMLGWIGLAVVLIVSSISVFSRIDQEVFGALETRAMSNAKTIQSDISFELAAKMGDEIQAKLNGFMEKMDSAHLISVLDADGNAIAEVGQKVEAKQLIGSFSNLDKADSARNDHLRLIVSVVPVASESSGDGDEKPLGYVILAESLSSYYKFKSNLLGGSLIGALVCFAFIMGLTYFIGHRTAKPILALVSAAQRIASGDLKQIDIEVKGSAETNRLTESVKAMATALQQQVFAIKRLMVDITNIAKDVSDSMNHLAGSANEQAASIVRTAATIEEMAQTGKSAAVNANHIVKAAEKTTEGSIRGRAAVESTSSFISRIKEDSQNISEKSQNLLSSVEEVGNIIRTVNGIAEQSKILAINASIEAAKAGEYGSGFAVVAREVKDLAQQSKDATLQITRTLTAVRRAIENMVEISQSGRERTEEGVFMISNVGAIMNDLAEAIRENSDIANVIATSINEQTEGLAQIDETMGHINSTATENKGISRNIVTSTEELTQSFERLSELVDVWRIPDKESVTPQDPTTNRG
ncbi:MAG: methyl-accepting chemotaxis protein [Myxococcota bacterium]|nr:methyl-accepting chemotaxis protein [Myxococcota bacterium]